MNLCNLYLDKILNTLKSKIIIYQGDEQNVCKQRINRTATFRFCF
jgi:hypothetical protein